MRAGQLLSVGLLLVTSVIAIQPVRPTRGAPWPYPASLTQASTFLLIRPADFTFRILGKRDCDVGDSAVRRYQELLKSSLGKKDGGFPRPNVRGILSHLDVTIRAPICHTYPHPFINESYAMKITKEEATLTAETIWGVLRGLETFVQLAVNVGHSQYLLIKETTVEDYPRFSHRGLLIDTSRHYLPVNIIYTMIRALEINKMNVLHWHIVDDESFPYRSSVFPQLSIYGAYDSETMVYTERDILDITEFARLRGVRVIPEFDTPGHIRSWGEGIPELITECYEAVGVKTRTGPLDPSRESNYDTLRKLFGEISARYPDPYIHLGGDEVNHFCWDTNPKIQDFMASKNMTRSVQLEDYHMKRMFEIADFYNISTIVWQEPFQRGVKLPKSTMVQIWLGNYQKLLKQVTEAGHKAILSECWYLDHVEQSLYGGGGDWKRFYKCEPTWDGATPAEEKMIAGGEACMWGEYVDETNVLQRVWPRASAAAERLWSAGLGPNPSPEAAARRLEEHTCRMRARGIPAQPPNGPGFCPTL